MVAFFNRQQQTKKLVHKRANKKKWWVYRSPVNSPVIHVGGPEGTSSVWREEFCEMGMFWAWNERRIMDMDGQWWKNGELSIA